MAINIFKSHSSFILSAFLILLMSSGSIYAQDGGRIENQPDELEGVGITEHPNAQLPMELEFFDSNGDPVKLSDYMDGKRPFILNLVYFKCPMLCGLILNGMIDSLKELEWTPGQEFDILTVSINPLETPKLARLNKQNYLKTYGRPSAHSGWHFLTGKEENIKKLTEAVGFEYKYDEKTDQYLHAACIFVLTPDGRISRYLYGVMYEPKTVRLSLVEASEGKIGTTFDRFLLYCFHYDSSTGTYAPQAMNIMRIGGGLTALLLGIFLAGLWFRKVSSLTPSKGTST